MCLVLLVGKDLLNALGSFDWRLLGVGFKKCLGLGLWDECTYNGIIIHKKSFYFCFRESAFPFM